MNIVSHKAEHKQNRGSEAINFTLISNFSLHFLERRLISVLSRLCKSVEWSSNTSRILQLTLSKLCFSPETNTRLSLARINFKSCYQTSLQKHRSLEFIINTMGRQCIALLPNHNSTNDRRVLSVRNVAHFTGVVSWLDEQWISRQGNKISWIEFLLPGRSR